MEDDQQFCLRWNNHQSTLIQNFDTLLESGTLVDCTLAAEGKYLKAHKVVLSACSPYFEGLLSEHYDKHPVFILKDVKFKELKAMMDYMYRGEVNISQDQLAALLKAAESLQIKGLSESKGGNGSTSNKPETRQQKTAPSTTQSSDIPHGSSGLTIEKNNKNNRHNLAQSSVSDLPEDSASPQLPKGLSSREGSQSPTARRRKRLRRRSMNDDNSIDNHEASNSSDMTQHVSGVNTTVDDKSEPVDPLGRSALMQQLTKPTDDMMTIEKPEPTDTLIEPKSEYLDDPEESVEDLTLDDDMNDLNEMEQDNNRAGPSHDPSQHPGLAAWHVSGDRSNASGVVGAAPGANDEVFLAAQEAAQAHRDSQDSGEEKVPVVKLSRVKTEDGYPCSNSGCDKVFKRMGSLKSHLEFSCGVNEPKFSCHVCGYKCRYKQNYYKHMYSHHQQRKRSGSKKSKSSTPKKYYHCETPDCQMKFIKKNDLDKHNITCNIPPRYKCFYCDYLCNDREDVEYHVSYVHHGQNMRFVDLQEVDGGSNNLGSIGLIQLCDIIEKPYICKKPSCNKTFALEAELINHQQSNCLALPERYKCPYCTKVGRFKCNIIRHIATHKNMPDTKPIDLMIDIETNNDTNTMPSMSTDSNNSSFNNHNLISPKVERPDNNDANDNADADDVNNLALYKCKYCEKRYKWKCVLVRHIHIKHPEKNVVVQQDITTTTTKPKNTIILSPSQHSSERTVFNCSNSGCNRAFNYKENLKYHRIYECKYSPRFKCGYCEHSTNLRFNLTKHLSTIHADEPPLIIDTEEQHNQDVKPTLYTCTNQGCDKVFHKNSTMENHAKNECQFATQQARYQCGYCCNFFTLKSSLIRHSRNKHKKKQIKIIDVLEVS